MSDFNYSKNYGNYSTVDVVAAQNTLLRKVYLWMTAALAITGALLCLVGGDHLAPRDAEDSAPEYTFDQFFPLHKED